MGKQPPRRRRHERIESEFFELASVEVNPRGPRRVHGLVVNSSAAGCCLVVESSSAPTGLAAGDECRVRVEGDEAVGATVRWTQALDLGLVQLGLEFEEAA